MGNFKNLPSDIVIDILARLPTESVLDCKLVCKPWRNLVSYHPSFNQLHLTRLNQLDNSGNKLGFILKIEKKYTEFHYFEYTENDDNKPVYRIRRSNINSQFMFSFTIIGSFNGLVCLYGRQNPSGCSYCIANPVTREGVLLPRGKRDCDNHYIRHCSGFGYLPLTNEYKVVEMYMLRAKPSAVEVWVYTLGSGKGWRNVGSVDSKFGDGVFVNGALHWFDFHQRRVFVFDLNLEKFVEPIPLPLSPDDSICGYHLGVFDGVLYFLNLAKDGYFDIWILKEKNDNMDRKEMVEHEPCWRKDFSHVDKEPLAFTRSGGDLCYDYRSLGIYGASKTLVEFKCLSQIFPHQTTLVSLKELGEEDTWVFP